MDLSLRSVSGILKYNFKIKLNTVLFYSDAEPYELLYGSGFKICDFSIWIKIRPDSRKENSNFKVIKYIYAFTVPSIKFF